MPDSIFDKSIPELKRWSSGERLAHRKLNGPVEAINRMVRGADAPHQWPVVGEVRDISAEPAIAVVLVEAPSLPDPPEEPGSPILKIRQVKYEAEPPVAEQYAWDGEAFDAYPAFGLTVGDFVGLEWDPGTDGVPDVDKTTFLKARFVDGFWLVDKPPVIVAQFQLNHPLGNILKASFFDGTVRGEQVDIAKPYLLRQTPFDGVGQERDGIRYIYENGNKRRASRLGEGETQIIVPAYVTGDIIYATKHVMGGVDLSVGLETVVWLDDNRDGRAWAAEFEEETASA